MPKTEGDFEVNVKSNIEGEKLITITDAETGDIVSYELDTKKQRITGTYPFGAPVDDNPYQNKDVVITIFPTDK